MAVDASTSDPGLLSHAGSVMDKILFTPNARVETGISFPSYPVLQARTRLIFHGRSSNFFFVLYSPITAALFRSAAASIELSFSSL